MMERVFGRLMSVLEILDCRVCPFGHDNAWTLRRLLNLAYHAAEPGQPDNVLQQVQLVMCGCSFSFILHMRQAIMCIPLAERKKVSWFFR